MIPTRPPKVLILATQDADARRWRESVLAAADVVWLRAGDVGPDEEPDVILTDDAALLAARDGSRDATFSRAAVLGIGAVAGADYALAADASPREIQTACRLLSEIAALRNQRDELAQFGRKVTQLADTDPLTGLPNRRVWQRRLSAVLAQRSHTDVPLWLAIVDLDRFKLVNDKFGMQRGDQVLVQAGAALVGGLRQRDLVARLGGDEFGLLLVGATAENLPAVFDRLRAALRDQADVAASIGYVAVGKSVPGNELFTAAERAMRSAKQAGGDRAVEGQPVGSVHPPADVE
ncbi:MAG: GGDEF domain-containing protein [Planctomycetota bacterium]|nr:MAG: GGDEF domain-containing protein [Planctomycetota bacterium]